MAKGSSRDTAEGGGLAAYIGGMFVYTARPNVDMMLPGLNAQGFIYQDITLFSYFLWLIMVEK